MAVVATITHQQSTLIKYKGMNGFVPLEKYYDHKEQVFSLETKCLLFCLSTFPPFNREMMGGTRINQARPRKIKEPFRVGP